jgi:hypothetical protein
MIDDTTVGDVGSDLYDLGSDLGSTDLQTAGNALIDTSNILSATTGNTNNAVTAPTGPKVPTPTKTGSSTGILLLLGLLGLGVYAYSKEA